MFKKLCSLILVCGLNSIASASPKSAENILATGDPLVHPLPYGFGSFPAQWIETLDKVAAYDFELLVPGHGEVQRDIEYLRKRASGLMDEPTTIDGHHRAVYSPLCATKCVSQGPIPVI